MNRFILFFFILGLWSCNPSKDLSVIPKEYQYSTSSAQMAIDIAKQIEQGKEITATQWESLFASKGYQVAFCAFDKTDTKELLNNAFHLVFNPQNKAELEQILAEPVPMGPSGRKNFIIQNLNELKGQIPKVEKFLTETNFTELLQQADSLAQTFLPADALSKDISLHEVHFTLMESNAYVTDCGLIMDINMAQGLGERDLVRTIAHEFHHNYRNQFLNTPDHPISRAIDQLQSEGIADLIDKEKPPVEKLGPYPESIVRAYNEMFANTPAKLKALDSLTIEHLDGKLDEEGIEGALQGFFVDGGHANGFYMALLIDQFKLKDQLIADFANPATFFKLYNEAAQQADKEYVLSSRFIEFLQSTRAKHEQQQASQSDATYKVEFVVEVPSATDEVYITGNKVGLGDWDPSKIKLESTTPTERRISLTLNSPAEFKFTRGSWDTEGMMEGKKNNRNLKLRFQQDTTVQYKVVGWVDQQQ